MATGLQLFYQTIYLQLFLVNEVKEVKGYSSETDFSDRMQSYITANMLMLLYAVEYPFILLYYFKGLLHVTAAFQHLNGSQTILAFCQVFVFLSPKIHKNICYCSSTKKIYIY